MTDAARQSLQTAIAQPYWLQSQPAALDFTRLSHDVQCDLAIVGGGFSGLWSALLAHERDPSKRILILEAGACGGQASGRNGGFCAPSISHGPSNALKRWPKEAEQLVRLGRQNLDELQADIERFELDVEFERNGKLSVATQPWQVAGLQAMARTLKRFNVDCHYLEGAALRQKLDSPLYSAGVWEPNYALLHPVKMVRELRRACLARGIEIYEHTPVTAFDERATHVQLSSGYGEVQARQAIMATNIFTSLMPSLGRKVIPIYDYALTTEPLTDAQLASIGWNDRYGIADAGNQFHYLRKTADNRILWGGFDAIYPFASRLDEALTQRPDTFLRLAEQFHTTFAQLGAVKFSHCWGGIIDSSARTTMFTGLSRKGRVAYALGFTGQGVSATRFAANTLLDLLAGEKTERTALKMLSRTPVMFPPEPVRYASIKLAQHGLAREDQNGQRSLFLRTLDAFGVGFDS